MLWLRESHLSLGLKGFYQSAYDYENEYFQNWASKLFLFTEWGSTKTGEQEGLIGTAMNCVLQVPKFLPQEQRFDIRVLVRCCICYINIKRFVPSLCLLLLWLQVREQPLQLSLTIYIYLVEVFKEGFCKDCVVLSSNHFPLCLVGITAALSLWII